jgi:hypothetical protein
MELNCADDGDRVWNYGPDRQTVPRKVIEIRLRWHNKLDPNINVDNWSRQ